MKKKIFFFIFIFEYHKKLPLLVLCMQWILSQFCRFSIRSHALWYIHFCCCRSHFCITILLLCAITILLCFYIRFHGRSHSFRPIGCGDLLSIHYRLQYLVFPVVENLDRKYWYPRLALYLRHCGFVK